MIVEFAVQLLQRRCQNCGGRLFSTTDEAVRAAEEFQLDQAENCPEVGTSIGGRRACVRCELLNTKGPESW